MTYLWCVDYSEEVYTDAAVKNPKELIGVPLSSGRSIAERFPQNTEVKLIAGDSYSDFVQAGPMFLVSEPLKMTLENDGANAEFLSVKTDTGKQMYFCNFLETVDCFDRDTSVFTPEGEFATNIEKLVLKPVPNEPVIYRVGMTIPVLIAVRDDLAKRIESSQFRGVLFKQPEDWQNPMFPV